MKTKELISQLAAEDDVDEEIYVRVENNDGTYRFAPIIGIAYQQDSYCGHNDYSRTTLLTEKPK